MADDDDAPYMCNFLLSFFLVLLLLLLYVDLNIERMNMYICIRGRRDDVGRFEIRRRNGPSIAAISSAFYHPHAEHAHTHTHDLKKKNNK